MKENGVKLQILLGESHYDEKYMKVAFDLTDDLP